MKMKHKLTYLLAFSAFLFSLALNAQQGKDGIGNIVVANTIANPVSTALTTSITAMTTNVITVASAAGITTGDLIYIIQMQGATVNAKTNMYGNPNKSIPDDTSCGRVNSYNSTGNNEFAEVTSVAGNNITLDCVVKNTYGDSAGGVPKVQVIRVPRYTSLTITNPGTLICNAWNGTTGGVVVVEVQGNTSIGAAASIDVSGKGFRGGGILNATGFTATNGGSNYGTPGNNPGAHKGESIVGDTNVYKRQNTGNYDGLSFWHSTPLTIGKANVANGGGGGNSNNCGGGGGSNGGDLLTWTGMGTADVSTANNINAWNNESAAAVNGSFRPTTSSGGGRGGYAFSGNNANPTTAGNGPNSPGIWAGDGRHNDGGWGGVPLNYAGGKIFAGGGGGAGDSNDGNGTAGGNGGGIVYLLSYGTVSGAGQILANGASALPTNTAGGAKHGDDGAGGGGGGGAVFINSVGAISLTNATAISAQGGAGGNFVARVGVTLNSNFGPGGGGGGGYVSSSASIGAGGISVAAGGNGIALQNAFNNTNIASKFPPNGASAGGIGTSNTNVTTYYLTSPNYTICAGSSASLTATPNGTGIPGALTYNWYNAAAGGAPIFTGNPYNTGALAVGTYTYYAGTCPGTYRTPVVVTVLTAPTVTITPSAATVCSGTAVTFTASGATTYTWSANAGSVTTATATAVPNPTTTTVYTVTGANGTCSNVKTVTITVNSFPTVTITPSAAAICSGTAVTFTASGATTYTWSANAGSVTTATATAAPSPTTTTVYTVTGANGTCTTTQTSTVTVTATPTVAIAPSATTICSGTAVTFTASGGTTYTWSANAGSVTTATASVSPVTNTIYTVTGANGTCTSTQTATITVNVAPTLTTTATPTVICVGQSALLTSAGGTTYTWSANAGSVTTATATVSPIVNTTYTVTGANGTCTSTQTVSVDVNTVPTLTTTATPTVICAGQSALLTSSGATTYTWSANAGSVTTSTASVSPIVNTTYTVSGANGTCTSTQTVSVNVNTIPTLTATATPTVICAGQSALLTAAGATTYTWSANAGSVTTSTASVSPVTTTIYTVTGANGTCTSTQTVSVDVTPLPTITITATPASICVGQTSTLTASGAANYTWSANAGSVTTPTASVSPVVTTTYTVMGDNSGCTSTQTISIAVSTSPTLTITATPAVICTGQSTTLTASGAINYTWSANAGSVTTSTVSVSPISTDTFVVTGDNLGCIGSQTITISVTTTPTVAIVSSATAAICSGTSVTLTASGATNYTWSANAGSVTTATASVTPAATSTYTVTGNNGACSVMQTITVSVTPTPTLTAIASNTMICSGSGVILTAGGAPSFTWSANAGSVTTATATASPTVTTTYTVTGDTAGCQSTQTVSVLVNIPPSKVDSVSNAASCNQTNGSYQINSITGGANPYQINFNGTGFTPIVTFTYTVPGLGAGTYPVVIKDNVGCTYTTSITINNTNGVTKVDSATTNAVCNPANSGSITLNSVTGGTGPYQVDVNGGGFNPIGSFPYTIPNLIVGTYTIDVKDVSGCQHITQITVGGVSGPTNATFSMIPDTCAKSVGSLTITTVTGGTPAYQYNINGGANQASNIFSPLAVGLYTVTVTDVNGCMYTQYDSVKTIGPAASPTITAGTPTTFCQGDSVTLTSSSATGNLWSNNATTQSITVLATGTYSLSVTQSGCTVNSNTVPVIVYPTPIITVSGSTTICSGNSTTLTASGGLNYTWTPSTGLSTSTTSVVTANPGTTTAYTITTSDANTCTTTATTTVTVNPTPGQPGIPDSTIYYCLFQTPLALNANATGGATLNWYDQNMNLLSGVPTPSTNTLGTTTYYVSQSLGSCQSAGMDSIKVFVITKPNANFTTSPATGEILAGQAVTFNPTQAPSSYLSYFWNFGDPASGANNGSFAVTGVHTYADAATYCASLTIISSYIPACPSTITNCIEVIPGVTVTIPNVFTPNQDNINDVFAVKSTGITDLTCSIFDRWGLKLYSWTGINGFWDGTDNKNGKGVTDGTYYYIIEATDLKKESHKYQGYIQLIH
jgi:gliding motility-associated-like protein